MNQEPQRQAVTLRYEPKKDAAPRLVTKGRGALAEKILELARLYKYSDPTGQKTFADSFPTRS